MITAEVAWLRTNRLVRELAVIESQIRAASELGRTEISITVTDYNRRGILEALREHGYSTHYNINLMQATVSWLPKSENKEV